MGLHKKDSYYNRVYSTGDKEVVFRAANKGEVEEAANKGMELFNKQLGKGRYSLFNMFEALIVSALNNNDHVNILRSYSKSLGVSLFKYWDCDEFLISRVQTNVCKYRRGEEVKWKAISDLQDYKDARIEELCIDMSWINKREFDKSVRFKLVDGIKRRASFRLDDEVLTSEMFQNAKVCSIRSRKVLESLRLVFLLRMYNASILDIFQVLHDADIAPRDKEGVSFMVAWMLDENIMHRERVKYREVFSSYKNGVYSCVVPETNSTMRKFSDVLNCFKEDGILSDVTTSRGLEIARNLII